VVTNPSQLDGTELYFYQGRQVIEVRDGSENMIRQIYHGTRYIDEHIMVRVKEGKASGVLFTRHAGGG